MSTVESLQEDIKQLKARNEKVEADKSWETSYTRRLLLIVFTYLAIGLYMNAVSIKDPWINAIVPSIGFLLSTLSLPFFKRIWLNTLYKK